jgi:hypothetical protein
MGLPRFLLSSTASALPDKQLRNIAMKKVIATLIAGLFASAAFAQTPATPATPAAPAAEASQPVKATIKPEADIAKAGKTEDGTKTAKAEPKHKKAKSHKKAQKAAPAAEGSSADVKPESTAANK